MDGGFLSVGKKAIGAAARPALKFASEQWHRRDAGLKDVDPATIDRELNEALALLLGEEQTAAAALAVWAKAKLSGRPTEFEQPQVKDWLRADDVQAILRDAARTLMLEQPIDALRGAAQKLYHAQSQDFEWYGGALFDMAVAFLVLTVTSKLSPGDRFLGDMIKGEGELVRSDIAALAGRVEDLSTKLSAAPEE